MKVDAKDILSRNSIFRLSWKAVKIHANFTSRLNAPARLAARSNKRQLICWTGRSSVPRRLLSKLSRSATLGSETFRPPTLGFAYEWRDQTFFLRTSGHGRKFLLAIFLGKSTTITDNHLQGYWIRDSGCSVDDVWNFLIVVTKTMKTNDKR